MDDKLINIISTDIIIRKLIQKKQIFNTLVGGADVASEIKKNKQCRIQIVLHTTMVGFGKYHCGHEWVWVIRSKLANNECGARTKVLRPINFGNRGP